MSRPDARRAGPPRGQLHRHLHIHGTGPLHRLAPEAKLVGLVAFVTAVALTPRRLVPALAFDAALVVAIVVAARLPLRVVATRLTVIAPFVGFALLVPFVGRGDRVDVVGLSLSGPGLWAAWNVLAKATIGATASIAVAATTPVPDAIAGLGRLRVPPLLVAIIAFMFRYLDVVVDEVARTRRAMVARAHDPRWLWQARPLASVTGAVFVRSYERGERVHAAMLARGYDGTMPDLDAPRVPVGQWAAVLGPATLAVLAALVLPAVAGADLGALRP